MSPRRTRILLALGGAAGLVALAALAVFLFVDADRFRPRLEAAATDALGMDVRFGGRLRAGIFPGLHLTATDGRVSDGSGAVVASAERIRFGIALLPLLRRELRLGGLEVSRPRLTIERRPDGTLNVEGLAKAGGLLAWMDGASVVISDGTLLYADGRSGTRVEAAGIGLTVKRLRLANGSGGLRAKDLSLAAELECGEIRARTFAVSALKASIEGENGVVRITPVTMGLFGGRGSGDLTADFSGAVPSYRLRLALPRFRIEEFLATLSPDGAAEGAMDFTASLTSRGTSAREIVAAANGEVSLRGGHLTLVGNDLDRVLSRFESSQGFNLVDVGAVFLAGPLGLAVTKGYGFAGLFRGAGGTTDVRVLVSDWRFEAGVARAQDVALATARNRIALRGGLDFVHGRFADLTVAALNEDGCVRVRQVIRGPFARPVVEKPRVFASLAGPVMKVYRQARGLLPGGPCEVFYSGTVQPPD